MFPKDEALRSGSRRRGERTPAQNDKTKPEQLKLSKTYPLKWSTIAASYHARHKGRFYLYAQTRANVEALATVLFMDKVGDEAKEVVVIAVVAGDLGRMVTMLLAKGANDAAVLDAILASPAVDVDDNTTITDRSELFLDLIQIPWDAALLVHCHDGEDPRAATGGGHMPPSRPTPRRSCSTPCYRNSKSFP
jgi:hypothetical protein